MQWHAISKNAFGCLGNPERSGPFQDLGSVMETIQLDPPCAFPQNRAGKPKPIWVHKEGLLLPGWESQPAHARRLSPEMASVTLPSRPLDRPVV